MRVLVASLRAGAIAILRCEASAKASGVRLIFFGIAQYYVGRVTILGVKDDRLKSLLEVATKLDPGKAFSEAEIQAGMEGIDADAEAEWIFRVEGDGDDGGRRAGISGGCVASRWILDRRRGWDRWCWMGPIRG